jgi:hypothetical protein
MAEPIATGLDALRAARAHLTPATWLPASPSEWFAVDADGQGVPELSPRATRWTLTGAVYRMARGPSRAWNDALEALVAVSDAPKAGLLCLTILGWEEVPGRTLAHVHALLDMAIAALDAAPAARTEVSHG